jgi:diguanylate cyclase (GGDEF)-like protein/PAS domain S-box-containing protein
MFSQISFPTGVKPVVFTCSLATVFIAAISLVGWAAELPLLVSIVPGYPEMRVATATGLLLTGVSLYLLARSPSCGNYFAASLGAVFVIGSILLLTWSAIGFTTGAHFLPFDADGDGLPVPLHSLFNFMLLGIALLSLSIHERFRGASAIATLAMLASTYAAFLGHLYNSVHQGPALAGGMAVGSVAAFTAIGIALVMINPKCRVSDLLRSRTAGGAAARQLMPAVVIIPTLIGWLRVIGQERGLYDTAFGVSMSIFTLVMLMFGMIYYYSRRLHLADEKRKETERQLTEKENRYRDLFEYSQGILSTHDVTGRVTSVNRAMTMSLRYEASEVIGSSFRDYIEEAYRSHYDLYLRQVLNEGEAEGLVSMIDKQGQTVVWQYHNILVSEPDKEPYVLGNALDVTHLLRAQNALKTISLTDELTGLFNRRGFLTHAEQQLKLERHSSTARGLTLMFADMDGLKEINDTYGHQAGSEALKILAKLIKSAVRNADLVARWGGDEFVILTIGSPDENTEQVLERIRTRIDEYNSCSDKPYSIECSIGLAPVVLSGSRTFEEMIADADEAMYAEKKRRKAHRGMPVPRALGQPGAVFKI